MTNNKGLYSAFLQIMATMNLDDDSSPKRTALVFLATLAARASRHDDSLRAVKQLVHLNEELDDTEKALLWGAFRNVFIQRQRSLLALRCSALAVTRSVGFLLYQHKLEKDCLALCTEALNCF